MFPSIPSMLTNVPFGKIGDGVVFVLFLYPRGVNCLEKQKNNTALYAALDRPDFPAEKARPHTGWRSVRIASE